MLWDILKPQASALVKEIRRLVDNGEFISNKHCSSPDVRLMVTLLLELITDHTRELVSVTKQLCGVRGTAAADFSLSLNRFVQQITSISRLVGCTQETLHATVTTAHLMDATAPGNFLHSPLQEESQVTGSGAVSGVLIFTVLSALMGLVRAAYEEKE
ncbi:hypothetical protein GBAR_LOCUS23040 [Geodia barretti]|uniref:Uncharacterized protein n=1 Tax=Geodia barretti TaxID=519541 RepID=A0AA35T446_GEOBA|nr:hypothetical protein GBAR_LOCUS23040 [Geodia barretti]